MRLKRQLQRRQISITWATSALKMHRSPKEDRLEGVDDTRSNTSELDQDRKRRGKTDDLRAPAQLIVVELFGGVDAKFKWGMSVK